MAYEVRDIGLAPDGRKLVEWAERHMPVLMKIRRRFSREKPFEGINIGAALHVEAKTAALVRTLVSGGAEVSITGCNPLSTDDAVAASLAEQGVLVYAWRGETREEYYTNLRKVLETGPRLLIDDGADLISLVHSERADLAPDIVGATEETTTGVNRLRAMAESGELRFPVIAVNDTPAKRLFDNRFGTAESTLQAIMGITNSQIAGKEFVVVGFGFVGRGIATRAKGLGAIVTVVEPDPVKALEAAMMGFRVRRMDEAAEVGDIFVTATGSINVIRKRHFLKMRDGAILCNAGHFNVEIDVKGLERISVSRRKLLPDIEEFRLKDGRRLYLLAEGRLVNLAGERSLGHPAEIMDMSFSLQALSLEFLAKRGRELAAGVHEVPREIDRTVAELKLKSMGIGLEKPTSEQLRYAKSWKFGT